MIVNKNISIMLVRGVKLMDLNFAEVEEYLSNVKKAVKEGRYEIERNANREANSMLFSELFNLGRRCEKNNL